VATKHWPRLTALLLATGHWPLITACTPTSTEPQSPILTELSEAGAALGFSSFHGDGLGNLTVGKTTFASFRVLVSGRAFYEKDGYLVYELPPSEYERAELRAVALRFSPWRSPPPEEAILSQMILSLNLPQEALPALLVRLGGDFEEVTLPYSLNRYGEVAAATYLSKNAPYAVDADDKGIRIFVKRGMGNGE
jgi:hypothetical protein